MKHCLATLLILVSVASVKVPARELGLGVDYVNLTHPERSVAFVVRLDGCRLTVTQSELQKKTGTSDGRHWCPAVKLPISRKDSRELEQRLKRCLLMLEKCRTSEVLVSHEPSITFFDGKSQVDCFRKVTVNFKESDWAYFEDTLYIVVRFSKINSKIGPVVQKLRAKSLQSAVSTPAFALTDGQLYRT